MFVVALVEFWIYVWDQLNFSELRTAMDDALDLQDVPSHSAAPAARDDITHWSSTQRVLALTLQQDSTCEPDSTSPIASDDTQPKDSVAAAANESVPTHEVLRAEFDGLRRLALEKSGSNDVQVLIKSHLNNFCRCRQYSTEWDHFSRNNSPASRLLVHH